MFLFGGILFGWHVGRAPAAASSVECPHGYGPS
jgi:hypothetical protein